MWGLNWLDALLILLLAFGLGVGYYQGLLRQAVGLASLYLGAVLGAQYFGDLSRFLSRLFSTTPGELLNAVAFLAILFAVITILSLVAADAFKARLRVLPGLDHLGGMILGLLGTWIILTLAINVLSFATGVRMWDTSEEVRRFVHDGIIESHIATAAASTFPSILAAIRPWLPSGLPAMLSI